MLWDLLGTMAKHRGTSSEASLSLSLSEQRYSLLDRW